MLVEEAVYVTPQFESRIVLDFIVMEPSAKHTSAAIVEEAADSKDTPIIDKVKPLIDGAEL